MGWRPVALKSIALLTTNARKAEEWHNFLRHQGMACLQFDPARHTPAELLQAGHALVCREESSLVVPGTDLRAEPVHLAPVEHLCRIEAWQSAESSRFEARRAGYIDRTAPAEHGGWWDTQFRDALTGRTYTQQALLRGAKLSARTAALEQVVERYFAAPRHARYLVVPGDPLRVIDFDRRVSVMVDANPCLQALRGTPAQGFIEAAINQGLFVSLGQTRSQQVYFWPGVSGLPSVPRESSVDEAKFLLHDLVHFLIGRLVPCGPMTEHERQIFLAWAMVEEGLALILADGVFVHLLASAGVDYDFGQHKGYPFYQALGSPLERLPELLWANVRFFALGDRAGFADFGLDFDDPRAVKYLDGFDRFSMGDWLWNQRMALHARSDSDFYARWWQLAGPLNARAELGLLTPRDVAPHIPPGDPVRGVFDYILRHRLNGWGLNVPRVSPELETWRAVRRWLIGQLGFFATFDHVAAVRTAGQLLSRVDTAESVETLRAFVHQALEVAHQLGEVSADQARRWGELFPVFPPYYIGYKARPGLTPARIAARLLGPEGEAQTLEDELPGVVCIVTNPEHSRFLVDDDLELPGGPRHSESETAEVAWRRVAPALAERAVRWQRLRLPDTGRDLDVLTIELPEAELRGLGRTVSREEAETSPHALILATFLEAG